MSRGGHNCPLLQRSWKSYYESNHGVALLQRACEVAFALARLGTGATRLFPAGARVFRSSRWRKRMISRQHSRLGLLLAVGLASSGLGACSSSSGPGQAGGGSGPGPSGGSHQGTSGSVGSSGTASWRYGFGFWRYGFGFWRYGFGFWRHGFGFWRYGFVFGGTTSSSGGTASGGTASGGTASGGKPGSAGAGGKSASGGAGPGTRRRQRHVPEGPNKAR